MSCTLLRARPQEGVFAPNLGERSEFETPTPIEERGWQGSVGGFRTRIWFVNSDSGLRQNTQRGLWIRTGPTMPLHRFGGFMVNVCAAPGDMKKREPDSSEEEVT